MRLHRCHSGYQNTAVRRFLDPKVDIGGVSIRIRLFAFPSAQRSRLMMFNEKTAVRLFSLPDRRNWSCSNQNTGVCLSLRPSVEIDDFSIRMRLFVFFSARPSKLVMFQSEYGCSLFPPPDRRNRCCFNGNTAGRLSLPRASRLMLLNQTTAVRRFLHPKVEIGDVSIRIWLFAFSSARRSRLMMFQSEYSCSSFPGPNVEIDDVPIRIRLFAVPAARPSRSMLFESEHDWSSFPPRSVEIDVVESEYGGSPFPRPES